MFLSDSLWDRIFKSVHIDGHEWTRPFGSLVKIALAKDVEAVPADVHDTSVSIPVEECSSLTSSPVPVETG